MTKVLIHQEDILILNVYVPSNRDIKKKCEENTDRTKRENRQRQF